MTTQSRFCARTLQLALSALTLLFVLAVGVPAAAQHSSTECPAQTATVSSGGTVTIDVTDCAFNIGFAGIGGIDGGSFGAGDFEDHGSAVLRIEANTFWYLDYSHNGTTGIGETDVFEFADGSFNGDGDVQVTITINASASPITVSPATLPALTAGVPMSQTITSSGGVGTYSYAVQSGALPPGLTLSSTGVLSGTPTRRGGYSFSVRSTDSNGQFVDRGYTGTVGNPTLSIAPGSAAASRNSPFSQTLTVTGGVAPYSFLVETGSLPSGITLSSGGVISGTTTATVGAYPITVRVTDSSTGPGQYFEVENFTLNLTNNQAPTANAGPDQTVASGAGVTLDGTGSTDPEAQTLTYAWTQTGGPGVTLSSTTAGQPTFTAPTVAFNAAPVVLTFSLTVNDGAQNSAAADTVTVTVTAPVDLTAPTVTLAGMPNSVLPGEVVQLTVTFSEPVTGLDPTDFAISNGVATALSGSGTSYTLTVEAGGGGVLSVTLPADSAVDVALNGNLASNTLEAGAGVVTETEETIATYLQQRANALVGAQPGLIRLLQPNGQAQVAVSSKGFTFATSGDHPVWASVTGQWGEAGEADTRYVLGAVGTHVRLSERAILGLMLEIDQMKLSEPGRTVSGTGWLVGPYIAGQFNDHPVFYEGRILWGRTSNEIEQFGLPADGFDSDRMLAQFKLQGEMMLGTTKLLPFIDGSYVSDEQEAYVDGLANPIAAQTVEQSQVALGLDLNWTLASGGGLLEPMAGLSAVYTESSGSGAVELIEPAFQGWRGRLKAGLQYSTGSAVFDFSTFVDGLGTQDYRDYGLALSFSTQF